MFLWMCTSGRLLFVAVGLLPWVWPAGWGWWPALVAMLLLAHGLMQSTGPAWLNWMSDLIPRRVRGRYFARRGQLSTPVAIAASLGSAWVLDWADAKGSADLMLRVTSLLLVVSGLMGAMDILMFVGVKDEYEEVATPAGGRTARRDYGPIRRHTVPRRNQQ